MDESWRLVFVVDFVFLAVVGLLFIHAIDKTQRPAMDAGATL